MTMSFRFLSCSLTLLALAAGSAHAQQAPAAPTASAAAEAASAASDAESQRVDVVALKAPIEFPYARAYDAARKVDTASGGLTDLVFKVIDKAPAAAPLRVSLEYGETVTRLPLDPSNAFTLPPNPEALAANAVLTANRERRGLGVEVDIRPHVQGDNPLTMDDVNHLIEAGRQARKSLLPWYARVVTPTIRSLRICSLDAASRFALRSDTGAETALDARSEEDVYARPAHCVDLDPNSDARVKTSRLVLPADATFDYVGTMF
jgi:hypothetical protein